MKKIFNVVIYSDRNLKDYEIFKIKCDNILSRKLNNDEVSIKILTGEDNWMTEKYANEKKLELKIIPADWKNHGKMAGIKRNQKLVEIGNACIIFMKEGGENKGGAWRKNNPGYSFPAPTGY